LSFGLPPVQDGDSERRAARTAGRSAPLNGLRAGAPGVFPSDSLARITLMIETAADSAMSSLLRGPG
jgi:hypothetical protein